MAAESVPSNRALMDSIRNYRAIYDKSCVDYKDQPSEEQHLGGCGKFAQHRCKHRKAKVQHY